jgi:hypothetical protein
VKLDGDSLPLTNFIFTCDAGKLREVKPYQTRLLISKFLLLVECPVKMTI